MVMKGGTGGVSAQLPGEAAEAPLGQPSGWAGSAGPHGGCAVGGGGSVPVTLMAEQTWQVGPAQAVGQARAASAVEMPWLDMSQDGAGLCGLSTALRLPLLQATPFFICYFLIVKMCRKHKFTILTINK